MKVRGSGRFLKQMILETAGETVLDVGCGEGRFAEFSARNGRFTVAVDIDIERLKVVDGVPSVLADAARLPFHDDSFDTVLLFNIIEHTEDDVAVLKEASRIARRNILVSVPKEDTYPRHSSGLTYRGYIDPTHRRYYTEDRLTRTLEEAGFEDFRIVPYSRVRPALFYRRLGYPRWLLKILDRLLTLLARKTLYQTLFAEVRLSFL